MKFSYRGFNAMVIMNIMTVYGFLFLNIRCIFRHF